MKNFLSKTASWASLAAISLVFVVLGSALYLGYLGVLFYEEKIKMQEENADLKLTLSEIEKKLASTTIALKAEENKTNTFENQIYNISSTVGNLDKLAKTDKQLLQKYSKVYFLNEHYIPSHLGTITPDYLLNEKRSEQILSEVWPHLEALLQTASSSGARLKIISAYRSFAEQKSLKSKYTLTYGRGANTFSADQGYSEHQLGTTIDFTTPSLGSNFSSFEKEQAYTWLLNNAYKYGFVLSYPKSNRYYQFEPWHWRFVGVALATKLHNDNKYFYDLPQREIDLFLVNIFN